MKRLTTWILLAGSPLVIGLVGCGDKEEPIDEVLATDDPVEKPTFSEEEQAIVALRKMSSVEVHKDSDNVVEVNFSRKGADPALAAAREYLVKLKRLTVDLGATDVTDAGLKNLNGLTNLQSLFLINTNITDAGLKHLKGLTSLQFLNLRTNDVTDAGLEHLRGLTQLEVLWLDFTQVTDAGLKHLNGLTNLQSLGLEDTQVTDAGLVHLKGLAKLDSLSLSETNVTDVALEHLKGLTHLEHLWLTGTSVTDDGVKKLQQALPKCEISH